jgi:hypothetical protein
MESFCPLAVQAWRSGSRSARSTRQAPGRRGDRADRSRRSLRRRSRGVAGVRRRGEETVAIDSTLMKTRNELRDAMQKYDVEHARESS